MISILIADDDFNKISSIIISIQTYYSESVEIKQASNAQEALEALKESHFHLLISDLLMPLRFGEEPVEKGGEVLIKEIYKKSNQANTPIYIVGLTQYETIKHNFNGIWKVWKYDSASEDWKHKLRDLIFHISKIDSKIVKQKTETLFVEGPTDKEIIELAFTLFAKDHLKSLSIETINYGGGASWVERQIIIWGKTLFRKKDGTYLQAVGLFDNDKAGKDAIEAVKNHIQNDSAEKTTFSILALDRKYATHLIPIFTKGLMLPITMEEMFAPFCWQHALNSGWLTQRTLAEELLQDPQKWDKTNQSLKDFLTSLNIQDDSALYTTFKVNSDYKTKFVSYIKGLNHTDQQTALQSFSPLITDILTKLKLNDDKFAG